MKAISMRRLFRSNELRLGLLALILCLSSSVFGQTNSAARTGDFIRGSGSDFSFLSWVRPLEFQKGVSLDATGGNANTYYTSNNWTTTLQHFNSTNPASPIQFQNPLAGFGS